MKKWLILWISIFLLYNTAQAHESRPLYLKITELDSLLFFELSIPNTVHIENLPVLYLNEKAINGAIQWSNYTAGFRQKWELAYHQSSLKGSSIKIDYPVFNPVLSTIISIKYKDESEEQMVVIPPNNNYVVLQKEASKLEVRKQYTILGIEHIWAGIDHLLFVACLVFIAGFRKKLLLAITGFTCSHSITLVLAALNIVNLPTAPIEACIALSIIFLCYEIIHHHQTKASLTYQYPVAVSASFGLLHGLGFASVLSSIGLPHNSKLTALLFFNIGIEIGQLIFIALLFVLIVSATRLVKNKRIESLEPLVFKVGVYSVGILASYWFFERIL